MKADELTSNAIYDKLASTYATSFLTTYTQNLKYLLIRKLARPDSLCLDIGVSNGLYAIPLASSVRKVHGIDISSEMLEICRKNAGSAGTLNVELDLMSAAELRFDDETFDMVYSFSTLLLVARARDAYREIARVLKPGAVAVLDITGRYNLSQVFWSRYYRANGHFGVNSHSFGEITSLFRNLGLDVLEAHPTGVLDQWKYIPLIRRLTFLDDVFHRSADAPDLDYKVSRLLPAIANRWYFVVKKAGHP